MAEDRKRNMPNWESVYQDAENETMPWYNPNLDSDLKMTLEELSVSSGTFLDLGTGPGTQAIELAKLGFEVFGCDISETAIKRADHLAKGIGVRVNFFQDDILNSKINTQYDFVFDRGCFHVFHEGQRPFYVEQISKIIKSGGNFFLKTFSREEKWEQGPYRFTPEEINEYFAKDFEVLSIRESVYEGTMDFQPKALFCILRKK